MFFKKLKIRREEQRREKHWKKYGRKKVVNTVYRYLRLHPELLNDAVYKKMFDYHRNELIVYIKQDLKSKDMNDTKCGELVDILADIYIRSGSEYVDAYKPLIDKLYDIWKRSSDIPEDLLNHPFP